jgi:hypothetical protein
MVDCGRRICSILAQLHPAFVYRRLQPEDIILVGNRVALAGLGFSFLPDGFEKEKNPYRAPEQILDADTREVGCWTDIYGFGVVFGEMLTGKCIGMESSVARAKQQHGDPEFHPLHAWHTVPGELKDVVIHCTCLLPDQRPKKMEDIKRKLSQWLLFRRSEIIHCSEMGEERNVDNRLNPRMPSIRLNGQLLARDTEKISLPACEKRASLHTDRLPEWGSVEMTNKQAPFGLSRLGPILCSFYVKAILRTSVMSKREGPFPSENAAANRRKTRGQPILGKWGIWFVITFGILLFLISQMINVDVLSYMKQPMKPVIVESAVVKQDLGVVRKEVVDALVAKKEGCDALVVGYENAKIPGNPEKTARNFRKVQHEVRVLMEEITKIGITEKDLEQIATLEVELLKALGSSAEIFADYLEGERKISGGIDWVDEANALYWKVLEKQSQVIQELEKVKSQH